MYAESEMKQALHVQSTQNYEGRSQKCVKSHQLFSFPGILRTRCSFLFIIAHVTTADFEKSDQYRKSVLQTVARADSGASPG